MRQAAARSRVHKSTMGREEGVNSTINLEKEEGREEPMAFVTSRCCYSRSAQKARRKVAAGYE